MASLGNNIKGSSRFGVGCQVFSSNLARWKNKVVFESIFRTSVKLRMIDVVEIYL